MVIEKKRTIPGGLFVTFEGPDGGGKTTQIKNLVDYLTRRGWSVFQTREPGGTRIGEQTRGIIHDLRNVAMLPNTEILLYNASRAQLVGEEIRPHLERGDIVLCDRYADSTRAYQCFGWQRGRKLVEAAIWVATEGLGPDLTFLLDLDPQVGLTRRQVEGGEWNRMDALALEFHARVRLGYLHLVEENPERWRIIDAEREVWRVQQMIRDELEDKLATV